MLYIMSYLDTRSPWRKARHALAAYLICFGLALAMGLSYCRYFGEGNGLPVVIITIVVAFIPFPIMLGIIRGMYIAKRAVLLTGVTPVILPTGSSRGKRRLTLPTVYARINDDHLFWEVRSSLNENSRVIVNTTITEMGRIWES